MMFRVALISMPFAGVHIPSLALTQLKAALAREHGDAVHTDIFYLNHDFAQFFGMDLYRYLSDDGRSTVTGFTDWLFRQIAFPQAEDNAPQYFARYRHSIGLPPGVLDELLVKRARLGGYLDGLIDQYGLADYALAGFTSMFDQIVASIAMARRLRARNPDLTTVMGGASCEPGVGKVLAKQVDALDFVLSGPALRSFPELVGHLVRGEPQRCHRIQGCYSRKSLERQLLRQSSGLGVEEDIDVRLPLDYDAFLHSLHGKCPGIEPELFFETSRGCWWGERSHCTFCGLNGTAMTFRSMSPANAIAQFSELFERYPHIQRFFAVDNILDATYFATVLPFVKPPPGASIFYETRVITNEDQMRLLAEAGITRIQPGIESLSTSVLTLMKKGTNAFRNVKFLKNISRYGIEIEWNLLTGFPNEDGDVYDQYVKVIPSLVHLPPPGATFPVRFDRHSPYHKDPAAFGLRLRPLDFYALVYPFADEDLEQLAYFWGDHSFSNGYLFNLARSQRKVEAAVAHWRARWTRDDGKLGPALTFMEGRDTIYDSRSGEAVEHPLSPLGRAILQHLESPMSRGDLERAMGLDEHDVVAELAALDKLSLLFQEGDRMLSLVTQPSTRGSEVLQ